MSPFTILMIAAPVALLIGLNWGFLTDLARYFRDAVWPR